MGGINRKWPPPGGPLVIDGPQRRGGGVPSCQDPADGTSLLARCRTGVPVNQEAQSPLLGYLRTPTINGKQSRVSHSSSLGSSNARP